MEEIIIVNENDDELGFGEKLQVHLDGILHRAFSIFVFNDDGELLLQKRAQEKYHSGGLWTNTCCSHPNKGESLENAVHRRLVEEMGFNCKLDEIFTYRYQADLDKGIIENEYDHIFIGKYNKNPELNSEEASEYKWSKIDDLIVDVSNNPDFYTFWFIGILPELKKYLDSKKN